ncbi:hypothetical protein FQZ97_837200 [compost metagenome]
MHERGLHVHRQQHAEPDQVDAHLVRHGGQQRHHDERQLEVVEEERQEEDQHVHCDQEAHRAAGQRGQQVLDPDRAIGGLEHQAEHRCADQDEHHEARQPRGRAQRLLEQREAHATAHPGHHQRAHGTHGAAFGGRGHAQEDGAQHQEDQQQRRDQHEGDPFGQARQQVELEALVDQRDHQRDEHTAAHGDHDLLVGGHEGHGLAWNQVCTVSMLRARNTATTADSAVMPTSEA